MSSVVSNLDLEHMATSYLESYETDNDNGMSHDYDGYSSPQDDIDSIFER